MPAAVSALFAGKFSYFASFVDRKKKTIRMQMDWAIIFSISLLA
jgi:hypothetical protein